MLKKLKIICKYQIFVVILRGFSIFADELPTATILDSQKCTKTQTNKM